ncbi:MAG TPA: hypothetical protein VGQ49_21960 [Bryobacteraceae bacterium]|jgi:hypothetical protein|nr:hypothetical protein [Bryobacteraceae bacterium]
MRVWILLAAVCCANSAVKGDERTQQLVASLSQQADAFRKIAPDVVGQETLFQRAMKPPKGGFHIRVGASAQKAAEPVWQERRILSEYSFAAFSGEGGALHELRRVTDVDGRKVQDSKKAQEDLAAIVTAPDDKRKKELLEQFEKYGLLGAVTDFGQLLLLFNSRDVMHYEFTYRRTEMQGVARVLVFGYQQIDGQEGLTVVDAKQGDSAHNVRIGGEVWVRENTFIPVRVTLLTDQNQVREEASVDYSMSPYGTLLPFWTEHRELRAGKVVAENKFSYSDFHKFDASSQVNFGATPSIAPPSK